MTRPLRLIFLLWSSALLAAPDTPLSGDAELKGVIGGQPIVLRTTSRLAGAID